MGILSLARSARPERRSSYGMDWYADLWQQFTFGGQLYSLYSQQGLAATVGAAYESNGPVHALITMRLFVFSEVQFLFQERRDGRYGRLYHRPRLGLLERPWTGATTRDLLALMEIDDSLAGNSFWFNAGSFVRAEPQLARMDPSKVIIITGDVADPSDRRKVARRLVGYGFDESGSGESPVLFEPGEVAHYRTRPSASEPFKGLSWVQTVLAEVNADNEATRFKQSYWRNGATPNLLFIAGPTDSEEKLKRWAKYVDENLRGTSSAFKNLYLSNGSDVKTVGSSLDESALKSVQGAGETRLAAAAGVSPVLVGFSESLSGSALNAGNYNSARRRFADGTMRSMWTAAANALSNLCPAPGGDRLWYDPRDVAFLQEDEADAAKVQSERASAMRQLVDGGFEPQSVIDAITSGDLTLLRHSGNLSVQLHPEGVVEPSAEVAPADGRGRLPFGATRHLPGQHDQSTHGRRGGVVSTPNDVLEIQGVYVQGEDAWPLSLTSGTWVHYTTPEAARRIAREGFDTGGRENLGGHEGFPDGSVFIGTHGTPETESLITGLDDTDRFAGMVVVKPKLQEGPGGYLFVNSEGATGMGWSDTVPREMVPIIQQRVADLRGQTMFPSRAAVAQVAQEFGYHGARFGWEEMVIFPQLDVEPARAARHLPGQHVQADHGKRGPRALANEAMTHGGFTFDDNKARLLRPDKGRAQSEHRGVVATGAPSAFMDADTWMRNRPAARAKIVGYMHQNAERLADPNVHVGAWLDRQNNVVVLDVVEVRPIAEAVRLGRERDQRAIWDLDGSDEVGTGGTGGYSDADGRQAGGGRSTRREDDDGRAGRRHGGRGVRRPALDGPGGAGGREPRSVAFDWRHLSGQHDQSTHGRRLSTVQGLADYDKPPFPPGHRAKIDRVVQETFGMTTDEAVAQMTENLLAVAERPDDKLPPGVASLSPTERAAWYSKEHADLTAIGESTDTPVERVAAMAAVTSGHTSWQVNKKITEGLCRTLHDDPEIELTAESLAEYNRWAEGRTHRLRGPDGEFLVRAHPELSPGTYRLSDLPPDVAAARADWPHKHMNTDFMVKAILIQRGAPIDDIVQGPKQRSFTNNLTDPTDGRFVTNDLWNYRVAAGDMPITRRVKTIDGTWDITLTLSEWEQGGRWYDPKGEPAKGLAPQDVFQSKPNSPTKGISNIGLYGVVHEATTRATALYNERHGTSLLPHEFQALAWMNAGGNNLGGGDDAQGAD